MLPRLYAGHFSCVDWNPSSLARTAVVLLSCFLFIHFDSCAPVGQELAELPEVPPLPIMQGGRDPTAMAALLPWSSADEGARRRQQAQQVVAQRLEAKTRYTSQRLRQKPRPAKENRFSEFVGYFFFPLLQNYDQPSNLFNMMVRLFPSCRCPCSCRRSPTGLLCSLLVLCISDQALYTVLLLLVFSASSLLVFLFHRHFPQGQDSLVLGRLVQALGVIVQAAGQAAVTRCMAVALIEYVPVWVCAGLDF